VSCAAAVAAKRTGRAVKVTLPRHVDMLITGHRHAFVAKYKASAEITEDGAKLVALDIQLYCNGGYSLDLSGPVSDRAVFHVDGVYLFPNLRVEGIACKTHQASHTAFRGFGGPQGMVAAEHVLDHLAVACNVGKGVLRRSNMYREGEATHFGQILGEGKSGKWHVPAMWDRLHSELNIPQRHNDIEEFNSKNKWTKRGAALLPTKFGVAFTAKYMNQGALLPSTFTLFLFILLLTLIHHQQEEHWSICTLMVPF
jgi:xanthine dehydrogenase/oxidase